MANYLGVGQRPHGKRRGLGLGAWFPYGLSGLPEGVTQANFDEDYYLTFSPDVKAAIPGSFSSGWDHFAQGGYNEGRRWRRLAMAPAPPLPVPVVSADPITIDPTSATFIQSLYRRYFGREPDISGWNFWTLELINKRKTQAEIEQAFAKDQEAANFTAAHLGAPSVITVAPGVTITPGASSPPTTGTVPAPVSTPPGSAAETAVAAATEETGIKKYLTKRNLLIVGGIGVGGFLVFKSQ